MTRCDKHQLRNKGSILHIFHQFKKIEGILFDSLDIGYLALRKVQNLVE